MNSSESIAMTTNCSRCGFPAFATLKVEAAIGETRLIVSGRAGDAGICAACMIGLARFFKTVGLCMSANRREGAAS
jgi:hypothetical protein